ncbi:antitoxin VbhA family protein [Dactylosporangium sp. NPDC051485]|uniref:antitoxin VbhA family protein n=1 Tax=Dactylosporangium sp. NPDC051485 TaxID=3154846 RepID=UPI00343E9BE8
MIPVEVCDELTAERSNSVAQATASLSAEGLAPSTDAAAITERWARGEISTAQMRAAIRKMHGIV